MAVLGVQMMMVRDQVAQDGMWEVLEKLAKLEIKAVEVSQIPMTEENTSDLERGIRELGIEVGALSVSLHPKAGIDSLSGEFEKIVSDCKRLEARFVRIGMMPFEAMVSKAATEAWAAELNPFAKKLKEHGVTLCYHNHHADLIQFEGERIFDIVRRVAPDVFFEVDLHWVQRGGMAPLDMLEEYSGVCKLIHVKDYRVAALPQEAVDLFEAGKFAEGY
ncbi:MAG: hypothetical protein RIS09_1280, partial [Actinomycetota bacterium]